MKKMFNDCFTKIEGISNTETEPAKFTNELVIQVDSDDNKHSTKKNNKLKIFFMVFVKSKFQSIFKSLRECFFFCKKTEEEDPASKPIAHNYSPEKTSSRVLDDLPKESKVKKTLILDLDETLVHSYFTPTKCDLYLEIPYQDKMLSFFINIRPGVDHFIEIMSEYYEIVIYTASMSEYADKVMEYLDKKKLVSQRLFRENCTFYRRGFVKDLSKIGRNLKDTIIVDNSPFSFAFQPENGIQIRPFFDDPNDKELFHLIPFLIFLSKTQDVRPINNWKEKFYGQVASFVYLDMNNKKQIYDKNKEQKNHEIQEQKLLQKKLKHQLQIDVKQSKKKTKNLSRQYGELESAEKMKKNEYDEYDGNRTDTFNDGFERKSTADFDNKLKEKSDFDDQRYNLDSSNINSPVIKKEILFNDEQKSEVTKPLNL